MRSNKYFSSSDIKNELNKRQIQPTSDLTNTFKYFRRSGVDLLDPDLDSAVETNALPRGQGRGRTGYYRECTFLRIVVIQMLSINNAMQNGNHTVHFVTLVSDKVLLTIECDCAEL